MQVLGGKIFLYKARSSALFLAQRVMFVDPEREGVMEKCHS